MEPGVLVMGRGVDQDVASVSIKEPLEIDTSIERHPGDGMEAIRVQQPPSQLSPSSTGKKLHAIVHQPSTPSPSPSPFPSPSLKKATAAVIQKTVSSTSSSPQLQRKNVRKPNEVPASLSMDDLVQVVRAESPEQFAAPSLPEPESNLSILVDSLKTKLAVSEEHNNQLVEEKMRLSHQLGVQTQVNNELKRLLVASIGDDMEQKYERMIQDKYLADLELQHLHTVLEEDREEVEQAMIQADVWRSKFLASRVMSDELSRWKSMLYYKYRETHTALQSLLEEHSKIRALNNATRKGLVKVVDLLGCKDPSLDSEKNLSTLDVAYMNNDLSESISEVMSLKMEKASAEKEVEAEGASNVAAAGGENVCACVLTPAENLAQQVVLNPGVQTEELSRMRRDYLAHNRISHFLSTNYQVTFNCCTQCKGGIENV